MFLPKALETPVTQLLDQMPTEVFPSPSADVKWQIHMNEWVHLGVCSALLYIDKIPLCFLQASIRR